MPLMRYFGFVGSGLVLLLVGIGWWFPQSVPDQMGSDTERPAIRISSVEHLPERVMIDTNLPTVTPPSQPTTTDFAQQRLQRSFAELNAIPISVAPKAIAEVIAKTKPAAKREAKKKVVTHRAAPPLTIAPAPTHIVPAAPPDTRMSFLETLKERLGQTIFKFN